MKRNRLGKSDLYVSEIGFGSMSLPDDDDEAIRLIHQALDAGVNFVDTADLYGRGRMEELVGKAIADRRTDVIVATKVGNHWEPGKPGWYWDPRPEYIKQAVKESLRRLGTDYIDLYQLHGGTIEDNIDDTVQAFEDLRAEGLIRWYGISSIRPNVIRRFIEQSGIVSVMMQYSILDRRPEETCLDLLLEQDISVIARGPVAKGMLTDSGSDRVQDDGYLDYQKDEILNLARHLQELTNETRNLTGLALRYPLAHPAVATVIPGASHSSQLEQNLRAASSPALCESEIKQIRQWSKTNVYQQHR